MDLFSLVARLTLDKSNYEQGINDAEESGRSFASRLGSGIKTAAKVGAAAVTAASGAVVALTKSAIDGYAEYEQLVGGVETLFKDSADTVQQYAANAYKTAGMSANEYMQTVTSFSASLLQSLGGNTAAAAEMADMAITDMSDNANKMGSDMASIQNAYNGFAKQNYTMLDNLKLGYGGTQAEMQRLLDDATKLSGVEYDISSYADIVSAIHVVQTELGITGTTAKEASSTISGSIASLKSAWTNLVTGLGDENADMGKLIDNVVDSAITAGNNLIPRVEQILQGIVSMIGKLGPVIADKLPGIVDNVLPSIISTAVSLVESLTQTLPSLIDTLISAVVSNLPTIVNLGLTLILAVAQGISDNLPELIPTIVDVVMQIVDTLTDPDTLSNLIDAALEIIIALADGLIDALPRLIEKAPTIVMNLVTALINNAPKLLTAGAELVANLGKGIVDSIGTGLAAIGKLWTSITGSISDFISGAWDWGKDLIENFTEGIKAFISKPIEAIKGLASKITSFLGFSEPEEGPLSNFHTYAPDMMKLFAEGITDNRSLITDAIGDAFNIQTSVAQGAGASGQEIVVEQSGGSGKSSAVMVVDGTVFAKLVYKFYNEYAEDIGVQIAGVKA